MEQPAMRDAELDTLLLHAMDEYGAVSVTKAKEFTQIQDTDVLVQSFARLVKNGIAIWIPGLPRQGVFFTRIANRGAYALPLMAQMGHSAKGWTRKETSEKAQHMLLILGGYSSMTIDELAEDLGWGRDTVARYLARLEAKGKVFSEVIHDGKPGRPPIGWSLVRDADDGEGVEVDFTHAAKGPRRRRGRT